MQSFTFSCKISQPWTPFFATKLLPEFPTCRDRIPGLSTSHSALICAFAEESTSGLNAPLVGLTSCGIEFPSCCYFTPPPPMKYGKLQRLANMKLICRGSQKGRNLANRQPKTLVFILVFRPHADLLAWASTVSARRVWVLAGLLAWRANRSKNIHKVTNSILKSSSYTDGSNFDRRTTSQKSLNELTVGVRVGARRLTDGLLTTLAFFYFLTFFCMMESGVRRWSWVFDYRIWSDKVRRKRATVRSTYPP